MDFLIGIFVYPLYGLEMMILGILFFFSIFYAFGSIWVLFLFLESFFPEKIDSTCYPKYEIERRKIRKWGFIYLILVPLIVGTPLYYMNHKWPVDPFGWMGHYEYKIDIDTYNNRGR